jgi:ABC-type nickel/cobalt efflux system permease component RcnA
LDISITIAVSAAFVLGAQHAFEPDHIVAISTMATRNSSILRSLMTGSIWGLGHTITLLVAGMLLILLKVQLPSSIADSFELAVGFMLIVLGIWALVSMKKKRLHVHTHSHNGATHTHIHSHSETESHEHAHVPFSVGIIHGLAGSGALVVLVMSSMTDVVQGFFFIASFGLGLILAMSLIASALGVPAALGGKSSVLIGPLFSGGAGLLSVALGTLIILGFFVR